MILVCAIEFPSVCIGSCAVVLMLTDVDVDVDLDVASPGLTDKFDELESGWRQF